MQLLCRSVCSPSGYAVGSFHFSSIGDLGMEQEKSTIDTKRYLRVLLHGSTLLFTLRV